MRIFIATILVSLLSMQAFASAEDTVLKRLLSISNDTQRMDAFHDYADYALIDHPREVISIGRVLLHDAVAAGKLPQVAMAERIIGIAYENITDYPKSLEYYLGALRIHKDILDYRAQITDLLHIARIYDLTDDRAAEKKYVMEAMAICDQHADNERIRKKRSNVVDFLATVYKKEGKYDSAFKLYNEAIELARKENDKFQQMGSLCNMAIALKNTKNYEASLSNYNSALALLDTTNDKYEMSIIAANMAILFYEMGDLARSEQHALTSMAIQTKSHFTDALKDDYETLMKIYTQQKKYPEALGYSQKLSAIKDTILNGEKSQQIKQLQAKFDTDAKDKQIAGQEKALKYNHRLNLLLVISSVLFLLLGVITYRNYSAQKKYNASLSKEKKRSEDLLLNILPAEVADELKDKGTAAARHFDNVTVLFTDFVNFTQASERMTPQELINELHYCFREFDDIIGRHNIEKIKTIGDSYLAVAGLPVPNTQHAENVINAALEIKAFISDRRKKMGAAAFEMRIGVHSGSVVAGIVGAKKFSYDIWGDTVNTAARMEQTSEPGKINISQTTYDLVKDKFRCTYRGEMEAKNKGLLKMYFVEQ